MIHRVLYLILSAMLNEYFLSTYHVTLMSLWPSSRARSTLHVIRQWVSIFGTVPRRGGASTEPGSGEITAFPEVCPLADSAFVASWLLLPCNFFVSLVNEKHYILKLIKVKTRNFSL